MSKVNEVGTDVVDMKRHSKVLDDLMKDMASQSMVQEYHTFILDRVEDPVDRLNSLALSGWMLVNVIQQAGGERVRYIMARMTVKGES